MYIQLYGACLVTPPVFADAQVESGAFTLYFTGACATAGQSCLYRYANAVTAAAETHTLIYTSAASRAYLGIALVPTPIVPLALGNLLLTNVQTTVAAAQTAATAVQLVQMNTSGAVLQTYAVPSASGASPCTLSGSPAEGRLAASIDGSYFTFACYAAAAGTASISGSSSTVAARATVSMSLDAVVQSADTVSTSLFSGWPVFSATVFSSAGDAYLLGQTSVNGWSAYNVGMGSGTASVVSSQGNGNDMYKVLIFAGSMYISYNSLSVGLVGSAGSPPATSASAVTVGTVVGGTGDLLYSFVFQNATWLWACVYGGASGQGVSRYVLASVGGTFANPYTTAGSWQWSANDCLDITGQIEPSGNFFVYWVSPGTATNTAVYRMATSAGATAVNIATSANQYRGIVVVGAYTPLSPTPTQTQSWTMSQMLSTSVSRTASQTQTLSKTASQTPSRTSTASRTPSQSQSPSVSTSQTLTQTTSASQTVTLSASPTVSLSPTQSRTKSQTQSGSLSPSPSRSPSQTASQTPSPIPFTAGNILALRASSSAALSSASVSIAIDELSYSGGSSMALVRSLALPSTSGGAFPPCTIQGNANLEGRLTRSSAGSVVTFSCYLAVSATPVISNTFSSLVPRAIVTIRPVRNLKTLSAAGHESPSAYVLAGWHA